MGDRLTVGQMALDHPVGVQIPVSQPLLLIHGKLQSKAFYDLVLVNMRSQHGVLGVNFNSGQFVVQKRPITALLYASMVKK